MIETHHEIYLNGPDILCLVIHKSFNKLVNGWGPFLMIYFVETPELL